MNDKADVTRTQAPPAYIRRVNHPLPPGESLLWEGAPDARAVARHVFRAHWLAAYFGAMLLLWALSFDGAWSSRPFVEGLLARGLASAVALAIAYGLAAIVARTSVYAITDRRVVLHIGMVLPMSINIPFSRLQSASVATFRDGTGQIALSLVEGNTLAYIALWPHCRAFTFKQPAPLLRGVHAPERVGHLLAQAVASAEPTVVRPECEEREAIEELIPQPA